MTFRPETLLMPTIRQIAIGVLLGLLGFALLRAIYSDYNSAITPDTSETQRVSEENRRAEQLNHELPQR